jgi:hypothetical protein
MPLLPRLAQPTGWWATSPLLGRRGDGAECRDAGRGGYFDVVASALGSGAVGAGAASIVLGSWSINQVFADAPVRDPGVFMVAAFGPAALPTWTTARPRRPIWNGTSARWSNGRAPRRCLCAGQTTWSARDDGGGRPDVPPLPLRRAARRASARRVLTGWRAGMTRATSCARCMRALPSSTAAMSPGADAAAGRGRSRSTCRAAAHARRTGRR